MLTHALCRRVRFIHIFVYNIDMTRTGNIESLIELASSQWGLFTSAQALRTGVSRTQLSRMSADGRVEPTSYATYRLTAGEETANCGVKSAWLSLVPKVSAYDRLKARPRDAIVACRTAAHMHGDTELHETPYVFAVTNGARTTRSDVVLHSWRIEECDITIIEGLPVTTVERTVADLVRTNEDPSLLGDFIVGVCSRGHVVDESRLAELLAPLASRNGFAKGDGVSFARRLVSDHAVEAQMEFAVGTISRVLQGSSADEATLQKFRDAVETLMKAEEQ